MSEARAELGARRVPPALAACAALLEHRAALLLGLPAASTTSMGRLLGEGTTAGEPALLRAWSYAAAGAADLARASVRPLLDGTTNWPAVVEALDKAGYRGYVTFEYFHPFPHYPEALIYQTSDALDRILGRKS